MDGTTEDRVNDAPVHGRLSAGTAPTPASCRITGRDRNCPSPADRPVLDIDADWRLVRCAACDVVLEDPLPTPAQLDGFYSSGWYAEQRGRFLPGVEAMLNWFMRTRMRWLRGRRPGRLLDYGSGKGRFLRVAKQEGWDVTGYEPVGPRGEFTEDRYGIRVYGGPVRELPPELTDLDAITMFHVLEHLVDPHDTLLNVHERLADDGILVVALPNIDSWQARWGGRWWLHLHAPMHLQHFSRQSLESTLDAAGFRVVQRGTWMAESNLFGWFQTIVNRVTGTHDLLFMTLKRVWRPRSRSDWKNLAAAVGVSALLGLLFPLLVVLATIEAAMGRGAVLHVAAVKA